MIKAVQVISQYFIMLANEPEIGKPYDDLFELRELIIPFGGTGYVALYRLDKSANAVYILAFRHQKQAGY